MTDTTEEKKAFEPNKALKPMKGAHLFVNESILCFIGAAVDEIHEAGGFNGEIDARIDSDDEKGILDDLLQIDGWHEQKDRFGRKVFKARPYVVVGDQEMKGELRVGAVLTRGQLMLDIRVWGEY